MCIDKKFILIPNVQYLGNIAPGSTAVVFDFIFTMKGLVKSQPLWGDYTSLEEQIKVINEFLDMAKKEGKYLNLIVEIR